MQRKITHRIDGEHATRGYFYNNESDNLITNIPVYDIKKQVMKNTEEQGHIRRNDTEASVMEKEQIVGIVKTGRIVSGYFINDASNSKRFVDRAAVLNMALEGKIGNARGQKYQGKIHYWWKTVQ